MWLFCEIVLQENMFLDVGLLSGDWTHNIQLYSGYFNTEM
jgi:hypothetical protein